MDLSQKLPVRVEYSKRTGDACYLVIYEISPDGREEFFERETNEVRWYQFVPSDAERQAARRLRDQGKGDGFIDLNHPPAP